MKKKDLIIENDRLTTLLINTKQDYESLHLCFMQYKKHNPNCINKIIQRTKQYDKLLPIFEVYYDGGFTVITGE